MGLTSKRRRVEEYQERNLSRIAKWTKIWNGVYTATAIASYIALVLAVGATVYFSIFDLNVLRALGSAMCTLILIHFNSSIPSPKEIPPEYFSM